MKPRAYVETSVISYLSAKPSSDIIVAGHQHVTINWWNDAATTVTLVASELVLQEAAAGDVVAAGLRLQALDGLELLAITEDAVQLAEELIRSAGIPQKAAEDALHISICATNGIEFLVTWNCRHIANAALRADIERICRTAGFEPPIICTPEEMAGNHGGELD